MDKKAKLALIASIVLVALLVVGLAVAKPRAKKACNDKADNDGDGYIDMDDPGCANPGDNSELNPTIECDDGSDNDGDGYIDYNDGGCSSPIDNDESNCGDSVCEGSEDCDNCATDCLGGGQVCCNGVAYTGDCCDDNDCTSPAVCIDYVCTIPNSCNDTDGGYVPETFGTVSGYDDELPYSYDDYCLSGLTMREYYCVGANWYSLGLNCTDLNMTSCINGTCVP